MNGLRKREKLKAFQPTLYVYTSRSYILCYYTSARNEGVQNLRNRWRSTFSGRASAGKLNGAVGVNNIISDHNRNIHRQGQVILGGCDKYVCVTG